MYSITFTKGVFLLKGLKSAIKWIAAIAVIFVVFGVLASINGLNVTRTAITVGGSEITEQEYKFYVEAIKMQVLSEQNLADEAAAADFLKNGMIEGKIASDYIKEKAEEQVLRNEIAVVKAKEAGISLTDEERSAARATEGMEETIKSYGVSKDVYADVMEKSQLVSKYYSHIVSAEPEKFAVANEELTDKINSEYALVQHVLIQNKPEGATEVDEEYAKEAKAKAEDVLKKATSGEIFANLIKDYNEDPGMESSPQGYLINKSGYTADGQGQMVAEFTDGAFAVKPNEVNPSLVESDYGWHIIKRCEITETNENYMSLLESVKSSLEYEKFEDYIDSFKDSIEIVKKDNILKKVSVKY